MKRALVPFILAAGLGCTPPQRGGDHGDGGQIPDGQGGGGAGGAGGGGAGGSGGSDGGSGAPDAPKGKCGELTATYRDFNKMHPDFEHFSGSTARKGLVKVDLGTDGTPDYAPAGPTEVTAGPMPFSQWYHDTPGINMRFPGSLMLKESKPGVFAFDSSAFFPLDGKGFGTEGNPHNFYFTTEIHASFTYKGGEKFTFRGDDDVWVFVNHKLALDLGGMHPPVEGSIDFDAQAPALGLARGGTYAFDVFHAERAIVDSNFRIETSVDCFCSATACGK